MWRRKDEDYAPKPAYTPAPAPESTKEGSTMATTSRGLDYEAPPRGGSTATIGKSVVIKGQIISREDLYLDGELEGSVELQEHRLTIGPNGRVHANVKAREIVIIGTVHGNVEASDKIEIRKEARLVGDIRTARIVIEDGAYFKGSIDITKPETGKQQASAAKAQAGSAAAAGVGAPTTSTPPAAPTAPLAAEAKR